ncbi:hypothetical protein AYI68_g3794 [Smittium mucronatum]|uniref:Uncharacterized protein n=1 Tax=Smittium mucronatum TaxID=133383 RepID=A0A1R0GYZ5_9FUNG|nr:hypothetical protein AYI68_g3794 [Smittium mucronatum]
MHNGYWDLLDIDNDGAEASAFPTHLTQNTHHFDSEQDSVYHDLNTDIKADLGLLKSNFGFSPNFYSSEKNEKNGLKRVPINQLSNQEFANISKNLAKYPEISKLIENQYLKRSITNKSRIKVQTPFHQCLKHQCLDGFDLLFYSFVLELDKTSAKSDDNIRLLNLDSCGDLSNIFLRKVQTFDKLEREASCEMEYSLPNYISSSSILCKPKLCSFNQDSALETNDLLFVGSSIRSQSGNLKSPIKYIKNEHPAKMEKSSGSKNIHSPKSSTNLYNFSYSNPQTKNCRNVPDSVCKKTIRAPTDFNSMRISSSRVSNSQPPLKSVSQHGSFLSNTRRIHTIQNGDQSIRNLNLGFTKNPDLNSKKTEATKTRLAFSGSSRLKFSTLPSRIPSPTKISRPSIRSIFTNHGSPPSLAPAPHLHPHPQSQTNTPRLFCKFPSKPLRPNTSSSSHHPSHISSTVHDFSAIKSPARLKLSSRQFS